MYLVRLYNLKGLQMYNKTIMVGRLTRDIELRYLPSGAAVAKSAIATSHTYKSQSGEKKEESCFLDFNMFNRSAEIANQYLKKGSKVLLEGRLVLEQWTGQDGANRSKHSLRVDSMTMLDSKSESMALQGSGEQGGQYSQSQSQQPQYGNQSSQTQPNVAKKQQQPECKIPEINIDEDEIPF